MFIVNKVTGHVLNSQHNVINICTLAAVCDTRSSCHPTQQWRTPANPAAFKIHILSQVTSIVWQETAHTGQQSYIYIQS